MKLRPETVTDVIKGWHILFPGKRSDADLVYLSAKFFKACIGTYSDEAFRVAAEVVEEDAEFFPAPASMRKVSDIVCQRIESKRCDENRLMLTETTDNLTPGEIEQNKQRVQIMIDQITGKITQEEAEERLSHIIGYAQS